MLSAGDFVIQIASNGAVDPEFGLYWRTLGVLAIANCILLGFSVHDTQRYVIIPVVISFVRCSLLGLNLLQIAETPALNHMMLLSGIGDFLLGVFTLMLIRKSGLLLYPARNFS
jgi:hypothetical protein